MKESFLHFLWKNKKYDTENLKTTDNESVQVIKNGFSNTNSGPDFTDAKIKIGDTMWAGNVEIHVNSSDWNKHKHCKDKMYDSVILQIVAFHDKDVYRTNGEKIPTLILDIDKEVLNNYNYLINNVKRNACVDFLHRIDYFELEQWKHRLLIERLEIKSNEIERILKQNLNNWEETFYIQLAKAFGFSTNSVPFEMLAKSLNLIYLAKHKNNLFQLEALLFGQSGFLNDEIEDDYFKKLKTEYQYLKKKYNLITMEQHIWKFMRMRPSNFPTIRIAQFASLIYKSSKLFSKILEIKNIDELKQLFYIKASKYWDTHYKFGKNSEYKIKNLGTNAIDVILINTVFVFLFIYGKYKQNPEYQDRALSFLERFPPENNSIIRKWKKYGLKIENAFDAQSVLQLEKQYCHKQQCVNCNIGAKLILNKYINLQEAETKFNQENK